MKPVCVFVAAILLLLPVHYLTGQAATDRNGPIAVSGGAQIETINIVRRKASDSAKGADLTNMVIELWLPGTWKNESRHYLVKILELKSIEDETGKLLSTKERLQYIWYLKGEVASACTKSFQGKEGPVIGFTLEAPERRANRIKSIKGKAEVSLASIKSLRFDDLASMRGKVLQHPKLKDLPIRPKVEIEDGETKITLGIPDDYARVHDWWLEKNGERLSLSSEGGTLIEGTFVSGKTFRGDRVKEYTLCIELAEPVESKVFEFDFKDIELP